MAWKCYNNITFILPKKREWQGEDRGKKSNIQTCSKAKQVDLSGCFADAFIYASQCRGCLREEDHACDRADQATEEEKSCMEIKRFAYGIS